jgi:hypothetical protein
MKRGRPAPLISLTPRQRQLLEKQQSKATIMVQHSARIAIILGAADGLGDTDLFRQLKVCRSTVTKWRKNWLRSYDELCAFEAGLAGQGVSDKELLTKMLAILSDSPRSGAPKRITLSQEQQITALACEKPEDFNIPITQWNREMLAKVAMAKGIVESVSPGYVSKILKKKAKTP